MKLYLLILIILMLCTSCIRNLDEEGIHEQMTARGKVVEQVSQHPVEGIYVRFVGTHSSSPVNVYAETITTAYGTFELPLDYSTLIKGCAVEVFADSLYDGTSIELESRGFGQEYYDIGTLYVNGPELPTVVTSTEINGIAATVAHGGGNVTSSGKSTVIRRGLCWSKLQYPTVANAYTTNGRGEGEFTTTMESLEVGTTYYVRAYATNGVGTAYGQQVSFTTLNGLPVISAQSSPVTNITATSAMSGGEVTDDGGFPVLHRGVCWSVSPGPTISNARTVDGNGTGSFISTLSGLTPSTTYYLRAYATNQNGTVYSQQRTFSTLSGLPVMSTQATTPTSVTATSAVINSSVVSDGGFPVTVRGVCYSTTPTPTISSPHTADGSGTGPYTSNLTNLTSNTTYYYRAYAKNAIGTVYGEERSFTTTN